MPAIMYISLLTFIASFIGTLSGFGTGTLLTTLLSPYLPYTQMLVFVGIIHWFQGLWKILLFRQEINWRLAFNIGIPSVIATIVGALIVTRMQMHAMLPMLGAFLICYTLYVWYAPAFNITPTLPVTTIGGLISGLFAGMFGIRGAIRSSFLTLFNLPKGTYLATTGLISMVTDTARIATYLLEGAQIDPTLFNGLLIFIPVSYAGALIARQIVYATPQKYFRTLISIFLLLMGIKLLLFCSDL